MNRVRQTALGTVVLVAVTVTAQDVDSQRRQLDGQISQWIESLDAPRFRDRVDASSGLQRAGSTALDALEQVVERGSVEATDRALDVLREHLESSDAQLESASREILERIAGQPDHPRSRVAQQILIRQTQESTDLRGAPVFRLQPPFLPARAAPPAIFRQRAMLPNNGNIRPNAQRIQTRISNNGKRKEITVTENGKTTRIVETPEGVEVEKDDGQGGSISKKYKDRDELKGKDPQAADWLKRVIDRSRRIPRQPLPGQLQPDFDPKGDFFKQREELLRRRDELLKRAREQRAQQRDAPAPENP